GSGSQQQFILTSTVTFNPTGTTNFIYTPTMQQVEALKAGIKEWTPNELLYGIGRGLLVSDVTDTVVNVQTTPDVAGAHVTIMTGGSVGANAGTLEIPIPVAPATYTTPQLLALATAERTDVQFLGAPPTNATVDFSGNTITLISDGGSNNWSADGLAVGDYISIEGKTQNSTDGGTLDQIIGLTPTVLTLSTTVATETSVQITIASVVANPLFEALPLTGQTTPAPESVNVNFVGNGFDNNTGLPMPGEIVRDDGGSWLADGFRVGDLVQLTGPAGSNNSTGVGLAYTVTAVTASTITLSNGDVIFPEGPETISIGRGQHPTITDIQVEQIAPVWISASGQLDITAGMNLSPGQGGVFIDSLNNVQIDQVIGGKSASYQGNIRIFTIGAGTNITNDASPGTPNIEGQNLVLESGHGGIGGSGGSNPITIDLVDQGTLTARAQTDVSITAVSGGLPGDNGGDMYVASVFSSSGNAYLTAPGSILDPFDNTSTIGKATQVQANNIYLIALGGS